MIKIKRIMTKKVITLEAGETILTAQQKMTAEKIRHLIVLDNGKLTGIISDRDILRAKSPTDLVSSYMSWPVYVLSDKTELKTALDEFLNQKVSAFVVENSNRQICGIITTEDILKYLQYKLTRQRSWDERAFAE